MGRVCYGVRRRSVICFGRWGCQGMKKRALKFGLIAVEVMAITITIIGAAATYLLWKIEREPISLGLIRGNVAHAIERQLPSAYKCEIGEITLARTATKGGYVARINDIKIYDGDGAETGRAASVDLKFAAGDLLAGKFGPQEVSAQQARISVIRNAAQTIEIPVIKKRKKKNPLNILSPIFDGQIFDSAFSLATIEDAEITFFDAASNRSWVSKDAAIRFEKTVNGLDASLSGNLDLGRQTAAISATAQHTNKSGVITASVEGQNFPVGDILTTFYGDRAGVVDAPVSGVAEIAFMSNGKVLSSNLSARVGEGSIRLGNNKAIVNAIEWDAQFDPERNYFSVEQFKFDIGESHGSLSGAVTLMFGEDIRKPRMIRFDLVGEALKIDAPSMLAGPLEMERANLAGAYLVSERVLSLGGLRAALPDFAIMGDYAMSFPREGEDGNRPSPMIRAALYFDQSINHQQLLSVWPLKTAKGARDWVDERMISATISNLNIDIDLKEGDVGDDRLIPDETMSITFDLSNAGAHYVNGMTPLVGVTGKGELRGNSFLLTADRGRVGNIKLSKGEVEFPEFIPRWQPSYIRFSAAGRSDDMLGVLDQNPMNLLSKINLSPEQFVGDASARVEIMRPNKRDVPSKDYRYDGAGRFENMTVTGLPGDGELTNASGSIELKPRSLTVSSEAFVGDAPLDITWRQNFFADDGPSKMDVSGIVDSATADAFGIPSRRYVRGPVKFSASALGSPGGFDNLALSADLSDAVLLVEPVGWRKPEGVAAEADLKMKFLPGEVKVEGLTIKGEGIDVLGTATFKNGGIEAANFPAFFLSDAADLNFSVARKPSGELGVTAVGDLLSVGPMLEGLMERNTATDENGEIDWGPGLAVTARIDRLRLRGDTAYAHASLDLWRNPIELQTLEFSALDQNGAPIKMSMALTGETAGPSQKVVVETDELGDFLSGAFGYNSIQGGSGEMHIDLGSPGQSGINGVINARNMHVVEAPLLARLFSAGSFEGLANLMNGKGIDFSEVYGEFALKNRVLSIANFRATGSSVGVTADGAVALSDQGGVQLNGAVAPVYQINSILGNTPILGDILVGKKGEGVVALSYSVSGERAAPDVFVNPLSALTPGVFRQLFDPFEPQNDNQPVKVEPVEAETAEDAPLPEAASAE